MIGEMELAAIWMEKPILFADGTKKSRLSEGMEICVWEDKIVNWQVSYPYTHKIIGCFGTIDSSMLYMTIMDLQTNIPSILKLK